MQLVYHQDNNNRVHTSRQYTESEKHAMQRAILNLFSKWNITKEQEAVLLGGVSEKTLQRWQNGSYGRVSIDNADRMSNLLAIHKALRILFPDLERVYSWVDKKNDALGGKTALEIMLQGHLTDIIYIRRYLDSVRGGW